MWLPKSVDSRLRGNDATDDIPFAELFQSAVKVVVGCRSLVWCARIVHWKQIRILSSLFVFRSFVLSERAVSMQILPPRVF